MKNIKSLIATIITLTVILFSMQSCYTPDPLYGKWADNQGNSINFVSDGTYNADINIQGTKVSYSGDWTVIENVLIFSFSDGGSINTEWDINGSMLKLTWTPKDGSDTVTLTLYHIVK